MLAIVPARAGSKGVPGKNKAIIAGKPLIEYTVAALEEARSVSGIALTTDDAEILAYYRDRPSVFLIERPASLASDEATTSSVVQHALEACQAGHGPIPDALLIAQPTTPLRVAADIDAAFELFRRDGGPSVISACRAEGIRHPRVMYRLKEGQLHGTPYVPGDGESQRRQRFEPVYQRNGAIYIVATEFFRRTGRLRSDSPVIYEMPWERSINVDTPGDLLIIRALIESGLLTQEPRR
jgi:CMP-N-acetylneuraminic acid synthetase